jgi:L-alanine-DL-glutamate epimerase-like enolase superfamily enzyme
MKITQLRFLQVKGTRLHDGAVNVAGFAVPMSVYSDRPVDGWMGTPPAPGEAISMEAIFLVIETGTGPSGMFGPISLDLARFIDQRLRSLLIGEDPHGIQRIWDRMYRANVSMLGAHLMFAIGAVDLALWDLKGKDLGAPVYKLLGGPTRDRVRAYASMPGYVNDPASAAERSRSLVAAGYHTIKWFFRRHPVDGEAGIRENIELIRCVREAVGPDVELMFDAWNSWDVAYATRMAELAAPYRVMFFEAAVRPDLIWQFAELRRTVKSTRVAGGEHAYGRWAVKAMLDIGAVDVLQPDPRWVGGISELVKICALASAYGVEVMPHAGGLAATHVIASEPIGLCPMQEHALRDAHTVHYFLTDKSVAVNGYIPLPTGPGLGLELDETVIESQEELAL